MRSCYMKNKTATELYLKAWVFLVIQESSNIENIFHYQSFFSSRFVDKNNCSFPLRSFPCSLLFFAAVAGGCVGYPSTNWLSLHPPALCSLLLARFYSACTKMTLFFFFFFFARWQLCFSRSVPASSPRTTSVELHTSKHDGGFPLHRASHI